jgi:hypothetical protein
LTERGAEGTEGQRGDVYAVAEGSIDSLARRMHLAGRADLLAFGKKLQHTHDLVGLRCSDSPTSLKVAFERLAERNGLTIPEE